jgi:hypothetical protein
MNDKIKVTASVLKGTTLTNEKRGGLKDVAFDRSPFKLFSLRFSNKSVEAPSSHRMKTEEICLKITA